MVEHKVRLSITFTARGDTKEEAQLNSILAQKSLVQWVKNFDAELVDIGVAAVPVSENHHTCAATNLPCIDCQLGPCESKREMKG